MSNRTREINKITTTIIGISVKLMVYALIILLLYEAVARGYAFGHEIFFAEAVDEAPGQDMVVQIDTKESVSDAAQFLAHKGLIKSEFAFIFQSKFYDYDTIYPGTYTLNTSMTSKEKPETEDSAKPAQSGGAKAAEAKTSQGRTSEKENGDSGASGQETSPAAAAASQDGAAAAAETDGEIPADAAPGSRSGEDALDSQEAQANEQTYEGEDQEMEGGWIEDAAEDGTQ